MKSLRDLLRQKIQSSDDEHNHLQASEIIIESPEITEEEDTSYILVSPEIVGYYDKEQQNHIYSVATRGNMSLSEKISILDLGCGRGDLYSFLKSEGWDFDYIGIESSSPLVDAGKINNPEINIQLASYHNLSNKDELASQWVYNIGNLNLNYGFAGAEFTKFDEFTNLLSISLSLAEKGVVFVLLDDNLENESYLSFPIHEMTLLLKTMFPMYRYNINFSEITNVYVLTIFRDAW